MTSNHAGVATTSTASVGAKGVVGPRFALLRFLVRRDPIAVFIVAVFLLAAIFGRWLEPHDPNVLDLATRLQGPSNAHPFGTDQFGRDLLSRIIAAAGVALKAAVMVLVLGGIIGTFLGLVAGGLRGMVDVVVSRAIEVIQGFPVILLALAIIAVTGPSLTHAMIAVALGAIPEFARIARALAIQLRNREFIEAARASGASEVWVLRSEVLPNMIGTMTVIASFWAAVAVMYESALSFLGLGVQPPVASYGVMLADAKGYLSEQPYFAIVAGLSLAAIILGLNLLGDALSDYYDRGRG